MFGKNRPGLHEMERTAGCGTSHLPLCCLLVGELLLMLLQKQLLLLLLQRLLHRQLLQLHLLLRRRLGLRGRATGLRELVLLLSELLLTRRGRNLSLRVRHLLLLQQQLLLLRHDGSVVHRVGSAPFGLHRLRDVDPVGRGGVGSCWGAARSICMRGFGEHIHQRTAWRWMDESWREVWRS